MDFYKKYKWFLCSEMADARCARHAVCGLVVGTILAIAIELIRRQPGESQDAHTLKMSLFWTRNTLPLLGAMAGSIVGLLISLLRWLIR